MQVLQAYYGLEDEKLWKLATGLGAGIGRQGFVCGALTGGTLAVGLVTATQRDSTREDVRDLRDETYWKVQELTRRFLAQHGTVHCREMTGVDFRTPEGQEAFTKNRGKELVCCPAVKLMVESAIDICG